MTIAFADARPQGLAVPFRPGQPLTVTMNWPVGELAGRTFVSTLDGVGLGLVVVGDTMTIEATDAQTAAVENPAEWLLTETTGGLSADLLIGTWKPSLAPGTPTSLALIVTVGSVEVAVTVVSGQASVVALGARVPLRHNWALDGWGAFDPVVMTANAPQSFTQSVANGKGTLTAASASGASLRVAYLRDGTDWVDSEITSLIVGPGGWTGANAQQGHIHRVRALGGGLYEGIAVWTAVVGGGYNLLNCRGVRFDGTSLFQSGGDGAASTDSGDIDRTVAVQARQRFTFLGAWINEYRCTPQHLNGLQPGDIVTVSGMDNSTFNETSLALSAADRGAGIAQLLDPVDTSAVAYATTPTGIIRPSGTDSQRQWCPYWMKTRVVGGTSSAVLVEIKRWRTNEAEPDWADPRIQRHTVTTSVDVPALAVGRGRCALWGAHFINGSSGTWGACLFQEAAAS